MTVPLTRAIDALQTGDSLTLASVPDGFDALVVADLTRALGALSEGPAALVHVARDGQRQQVLENALRFIAPEIEVLTFPAWDCQPYDRISPNAAVTAQRMTTLARLTRSRSSAERPRLLSTTVNAVLQRVPPRARVAAESFSAAPGNMVNMDALVAWLEMNGFLRSGTVRDTGEYAVRGGIVDLYAPGLAGPVRLDFFGDTLESIRSFDPETQRTVGQLRSLDLVPISEVQLTTESIRRFRQSYVAEFGAPTRDDRLYESVSEGRRYPGIEHWLPLFHDRLDTLLDYAEGVPVAFDTLVDDAAGERLGQVKDYYDARKTAVAASAGGRRALPPAAGRGAVHEAGGMGRAHGRARRRPSHALRHSGLGRAPRRRLRGAARAQLHRRARGGGHQRVRRRRAARARPASGRQARAGGRVVGRLTRAPLPCAQRPRPDADQERQSPRRRACPAQDRDSRRRLGAGGRLRGGRSRRPQRAGHPRRPARAAEAQVEAPAGFPHRGRGPDARRPRRARRSRHRPLRRIADHRGGGGAARLPGAELCRRRPPVPAGREHRAADALRIGRGRGAARPARRRRLAGAQVAHEEAHPRDGRRAHEDRRRAHHEGGAAPRPDGRPLRRVRGAFPLRGDGGPAERHRCRDGRPHDRAPDGPPHLRRRRFRQDRGGAAGRLRLRHGGQAGSDRRADDAARAPALPDVRRSLQRAAAQHRPGVTLRPERRVEEGQGRARRRQRRHRRRHARAPRQIHPLQGSRPDHRRRGAAFRRLAQGTPQGAAAPRFTS